MTKYLNDFFNYFCDDYYKEIETVLPEVINKEGSMRTIYKYELNSYGKETIDLPKNSKILSVGMQRSTIMIWVELDEREDVLEKRSLCIFGTGQAIPRDYDGVFLGTLITKQFVWHVYVDKKEGCGDYST